MYTGCTTTFFLKKKLCHTQHQIQPLFGAITLRRNNILQNILGGSAAGRDNFEVLFEVTCTQRRRHFFHPSVLAEEMQRPQNRTVTQGRPHRWYFVPHPVLITGMQRFRATFLRNSSHLFRDRWIGCGQVGMTAPGIDHHQQVIGAIHVKLNMLYGNIWWISKIDHQNSTDCRSRLIHQSTRFAEKSVLGILTDTGQGLWRNAPTVIEFIEDGTHQDLKASGWWQPGANPNITGDIGRKTPDPTTFPVNSGCYTPDQRRWGACFRRSWTQILDIDTELVLEAGRSDLNSAIIPRRHRSKCIFLHRCT